MITWRLFPPAGFEYQGTQLSAGGFGNLQGLFKSVSCGPQFASSNRRAGSIEALKQRETFSVQPPPGLTGSVTYFANQFNNSLF